MILILTGLANAQQTQGQTPIQPPASTPNLQADQASGGNPGSPTSPGASYEAYWLGGSVLYNGGSLTYTWTDKTLQWPDRNTNHVHQDAWAAGYDVPTAWSGEVNTSINNDGKIGLNTGNDKTNFICQYDIPMTVQQLLQSGMYPAGARRSLF